MKNTIATSLLILSTGFLASCSIGVTHDSTSIKQIKEVKLADGSVTRVGYTPAQDSWKCKQVQQKTGSLGANKFKGMLKLGGAYQVLEEGAIDYANQTHLKTNYIYLYSPTEVAANDFDFSAFSNTTTTFYLCKNPPAVTNKLF